MTIEHMPGNTEIPTGEGANQVAGEPYDVVIAQEPERGKPKPPRVLVAPGTQLPVLQSKTSEQNQEPATEPTRQSFPTHQEAMKYVLTLPEEEQVEEMRRLGLEVAGGSEVEVLESQKNTPDWWPKEDGFDQTKWEKLDEKDRTVQAAVLVMRHYYDMPDAVRAEENNEKMFSAAYQDFAEYALGKKLYDGKDTRIIAVELVLVNFDEVEIKKYKKDFEKQGKIIEALNKWDIFMREQVGIKAGRKSFGITPENEKDERVRPPHSSKEEWKKYLERPVEIDNELADVEQELVRLTSQEFVDRRKSIKTKVDDEVKAKKLEIEKEEKGKKKGILADVEEWEEKLEIRSLQDEETTLAADNPYQRKSVEEILKFIEKGEKSDTSNVTALEQANSALEWNFQQARKLGIFEDLEERLEGRYQELALSLFSQSRADQGDADMEGRRGSRNLTFAEAKEIIAKESDEHSLNSFTNTAELDASWKQLIRDGVVSRKDVNHFKGIRKAFVVRAYGQMYDSLSNLYKHFRYEELSKKWSPDDRHVKPVEIKRISGEWDVRKQERAVRGRLEKEERAQEDKLFYVDRYYLTLTGTTQEQVEKGVNNYLTSLLEGAHVYDVQTILQKLQYLSAAIMSKKDVLMQTGMSAPDAQDALTRINIFAENRGEFYVMNFAAQNLLMDEFFIPLYDKWAGVIGIEKMKMILDMNNGLVAPAMLLFLDKKNRLLFQPAGFKGQGMKNIWAQRALRNKIKEQLAEELVNYQAREAKPTELMEQATWQDFLRMKFERKYELKEGKPVDYNLKEAVSDAKTAYEAEKKRVESAHALNKATEEDLKSLRSLREKYAKLDNQYDRLLAEAKSAVETTWQVFNIFGESARLGAPSIIMDKDVHINIEDATYFYKFAILEAMKKNKDTPAQMRWRAYQWTKNSGKHDSKGNSIVEEKDGEVVKQTFILVKGLEDTGITLAVFTEFLKAAKELQTNSYQAVFESSTEKNADSTPRKYSFEEIINRNDVKPVRNNFISNYKASREIFANSVAMREAKKGRQPFIMKILKRLDQSGRGQFTALDRAKIDGKSLEELPDERLKEIFEDAITDSLIFHITVRQLARWEATFQPDKMDTSGNMEGKFSTSRIYYGSQDIPWGVKRLQYLPEYWMTNKRERIGRAWQLLPFIPLLKSGLAQECDAENLPDLIFNVNKEHIDEPGLKQTAAGFKDAQGWRQRGETSVDEQRGETIWSWWDKPTVDSAQYLKVVSKFPPRGKDSMDQLDMFDYINAKDPAVFTKQHPLLYGTKKELVDITREVLKREAPLNVFLEAQLGYNRSAGGSGIGLEMGERWHYRILNWWLSSKEGIRQEEGGLKVNSDAETFIKFVTIKNSWSDGMSILDEAWRQARGTRNTGVSDQSPREIIS